ncbi:MULTISPECIES: ABC transporter ATP-binding protein [Thermaerobacter]|uniref:ABC transporter ATP-binding protein n=1 Tax=Thermaerobacter composti TaxID=554949 RepID=A0ABZ0QR67_9FIRM|nr:MULTISPECIES: ABC transporter ATP-binding protein [Thermaerobacter]PZN09504.1 MAG: ABC transporter ATP-binding protein [Bacillota bacterium]QBS36888.1 ABC transporter ATP-binding protein [Thermaerobacter sp. FW80]WPD18873.1 ABC transporter ATP-binding protein [Thermaerobacter composti]
MTTPAAEHRSEPMLVVRNLVKRFGDKVAVDGVSFEVYPGESFGLLGPNGAGKSTTLAMIAGLLRPDAGEIEVGGLPLATRRREAQRLLGVVPQDVALYPELTAAQNMGYFAALRGLRGAEARRQIEEALALVGLTDHAGQRVERFSGGMKRRLNIAVGLLGRPRLLLLDEPTVGIDPQSRRHILEATRQLAATGVAVLYTSHYMEEVEFLCRRVAIMDHGRIIAQGPMDQVRALAGDAAVLRLPWDGVLRDEDPAALGRQLGVPVETTGGEVRFILPRGPEQAVELLGELVRRGVPVRGMRLETPDLETVFLALTGRALRD